MSAVDRCPPQPLQEFAERVFRALGAEGDAARGLIALVTVGSAGPGAGPVPAHGGRERFLGTNPWSIGVPAAGHDPFIFDAATSMIAQGKVHFAHARGAPLPPGSIVDK